MYISVTNQQQWVLDYPNPNHLYPDIWMSAHIAMFSVPVGKYVAVTGVLLQEKARLLYEQLSRMLQRFFQALLDKSCSQFTMSELAKRGRKRCRTLYYVVAS